MLTIPNDRLTLWSPEELAEALGVKEQTLADWRNARTRTSKGQRGGRIYYTSTAVMDWLQSLPVTHTTN